MQPLHQQCSECLSVLPTPYLLSIHISEQHDSFFTSQATQRMNVFRCLVEGCGSTFPSAAQRHQHLTDLHQIPAESGFDRCAKCLLSQPAFMPHIVRTVKQLGHISVHFWDHVALVKAADEAQHTCVVSDGSLMLISRTQCAQDHMQTKT